MAEIRGMGNLTFAYGETDRKGDHARRAVAQRLSSAAAAVRRGALARCRTVGEIRVIGSMQRGFRRDEKTYRASITRTEAFNAMCETDMLRAARALAKLALVRDRIPQRISNDEARECLRPLGWTDPSEVDPIQRLVAQGVLPEVPMVHQRALRFALSLVAEFLPAQEGLIKMRDAACITEACQREAAASPNAIADIGALRDVAVLMLQRM